MNKIKVAIADDHEMVVSSLALLLGAVPWIEVVAKVSTGRDALRMVRNEPIDCLLLDLSLPDISGMDVLKTIRRSDPKLGVLILSGSSEEHYAVRAFKSGASGYIHKAAPIEDLLQAIKHIQQQKKYVSPKVAALLVDNLHQPEDKMPHEALSDREYQFMVMSASGMTVTEIAQKMSLSSKTVSAFRTRALRKMALPTTAALVHYAIKNNIV
jgi:DNA-binding NarL/FixJ family response regulator